MNYENLISIVMPVFNAQAYLEEALIYLQMADIRCLQIYAINYMK